jgi:hypothetical protein
MIGGVCAAIWRQSHIMSRIWGLCVNVCVIHMKVISTDSLNEIFF